MTWSVLADVVLLFHGLFVVFVVVGGLLVLRRRWVAWLHVPCALWGAWVEVAGWVCPLTPLENRFRRMAGEAGYEGGFIERYVTAALYPEGLTRGTQIALGTAVLLLNAGIYAWVMRRGRG